MPVLWPLAPFQFPKAGLPFLRPRTLASLFLPTQAFLRLPHREPQIGAFTTALPNRDVPLLDRTSELTENWLGFVNKRLPNGNSGCLELLTQRQLLDGELESAQMREGQSRN